MSKSPEELLGLVPNTTTTATHAAPNAPAAPTNNKDTSVDASGDEADASDAPELVTDANGGIVPYRFTPSPEKGKKALVRFRETLKKYYSSCNLSEGLSLRDNPVLELFCYDVESDVGYCRLASAKHDGPVFQNPKQLYETYNCSSQGHMDEVFVFCDETDEDHGMELLAFLRQMEIIKPQQFPPEYRDMFEKAVADNPLLKMYNTSLEEKRASKKSRSSAAKASSKTSAAPPTGSTNDANTTQGVESTKTAKTTSGVADGAAAAASASKKRAAPTLVPPNVAAASAEKQSTPLKKSKTVEEPTRLTAQNESVRVGSSALSLLTSSAVTMENVCVDLSNLDNCTAQLVVHVRRGDLAPNSVERAALDWHVLQHMLSTSGRLLDAEQLLARLAGQEDQSEMMREMEELLK